MDKLTYLKTSR
jgi:hypothetical protein